MNPRQAILNELLAKNTVVSLHHRVEALHPASPHRVFPTSSNREWAAQFFAGVSFCQHTYRHILIDGNSKILCLFLNAVAEFSIGFRRINEIKPENVFLPIDADMETVSVIRTLGQITTILQSSLGPARAGDNPEIIGARETFRSRKLKRDQNEREQPNEPVPHAETSNWLINLNVS
jgi:hypothetical protein